MSHVGFPFSKSLVGKIASTCVLSDQVSGVRRSMLRSDRFGCCWGMLMGSGPRKIVFSTFAETRDIPMLMKMHISSWGTIIGS